MIETVFLGKKFNGKWVLRGLNLNIKSGEFYCLLGPNGAGKTTTLKLLTSLLKPDEGRVILGGFDLAKQSQEAKRLLAFIPDAPFVYDNLTAEEFLYFVGNIFRVEKKVLRKRINYYLELFEMTVYRDILLGDYSHGMQQRIVYICNLIHNPQIILIDEPLVGLDPQTIRMVKRILRREIKKGAAIIMCTHILNIAEELADRIGILLKGKLIAEGTLAELRDKIGRTSLEDIFIKLTV